MPIINTAHVQEQIRFDLANTTQYVIEPLQFDVIKAPWIAIL